MASGPPNIHQKTHTYPKEDPRRRTPRRSYRRTVGVLIDGAYSVFDGRSLSEGGIGFTIANDRKSQVDLDQFRVGANVLVSFILPSGVPLILRGSIVHNSEDKAAGHAVGVKFNSFALHHRREIRYYVSAKEAGESDL